MVGEQRVTMKRFNIFLLVALSAFALAANGGKYARFTLRSFDVSYAAACRCSVHMLLQIFDHATVEFLSSEKN